MKKTLVILFFISFFWRFLFLQAGVQSLTHDEIDFYYSGYKLSHTGSDEYGNGLFLTTGYISAIPSIPVYISALGWKLFPEKTPINARLPFVILNSFTPVFIFLIVHKLTKNKKLSFLSFAVFQFSPWFSHVSSRVAYDAPLALLFSLIGFYALIAIRKKWAAFVLFGLSNFFSFNSYMGFKTVLPFFIFIQLFVYFTFEKPREKNMGKPILKSALIATALFFLYFSLLFLLPAAQLVFLRGKRELLTPFSSSVGNYLWYAHWTTDGTSIVSKLIYNKITGWIFLFFSKYFESFNVNMFFLTGEPSGVYGLRVMGLFFLTDLFFLIYGFFSFSKLPAFFKRLLLLTLSIGGIPFAISASEVTVSLRGILLLFPYSILIAYGMSVFSNTRIKKILLCCVMAVNIFAFAYLYTYQISTISAENYYLTDTEIARELIHTKEKTIIASSDPYGLFMQYAFYKRLLYLQTTCRYENKKLSICKCHLHQQLQTA